MHFGMDIGSFSIKIAQCQKKGQVYTLEHWGETTTPVATSATDYNSKVALAETIKKLVREAGVTTNNVGLAIAEANVYSRVILLPVLSDTELASAIEFEAEQYIPLPLDQVQLEYFVLNRPLKPTPESKMEVLLIAAQKKAINELLSLMEIVGLVPEFLETEMLALSRSLANFPDTSLLVNIGRQATDLAILEGQDLRFVYNFNIGGEVLTRALSQNLSLDINQAEEYKRTYGLDETLLEGKVAKILLGPFNQIIQQIQKTINFYSQNYKDRPPIKRLILAGGTAEMPGITSFLTKTIGIETVLGNPFANFEQNKLKPELLKSASRFATSVGLAMRQTS